MDVHVALPHGHLGVTVEQLAEITDAAEELGFAGVWPLDHILVGPDLKERYPWVVEPLTLLGYLAARTRKIRLGTAYYRPELDGAPPFYWTDGEHMWHLLRACQRWSHARLKWRVTHGIDLPPPGMRDRYVASVLVPRRDLYPDVA
jgi:Luciferase-like monooxygenase